MQIAGKVSFVPRNGLRIRDQRVLHGPKAHFEAILDCPLSACRFRYSVITGKV